MVGHTRRHLLGTAASLASAGFLSGCTALPETRNAQTGGNGTNQAITAQSSFFVFGAFASAIAGNLANVNTLVPLGQHGHGWEPGPQIQGTVLESDLFIHGTEGFQPWADDLVASLREDDSDVTVVAAGSAVEFLRADHHHQHNSEARGTHEHNESRDHGNGNGNRTDSRHREPGHDNEHENGAESRPHRNEPGEADPHFWLDPMRAKKAVGTIQRGLTRADGTAADAYATHADRYRSRLDDLDGRFRTALNGRSNDVVLVAGHNAFQYLGERYGFDITARTGLSPDYQPTLRDIERAQRIIDEHALEHVVADPLESRRAAAQLVAETTAESVLPLTAMPGLTEAWSNKGWGYVEIMEQVNLPTLERALGVR